MSTHILDVSGARPLTTTLNDPAATRASTSAKAGDDVFVQVGGARETRMVIPSGTKIQRRRYVSRKQMTDSDHRPVKDEAGEYVYEETPYEELVLVLTGSLVAFSRSSHLPIEGEEQPSYEPTPHTTLSARRFPEPHFTESGELLSEAILGEVVTFKDAAAALTQTLDTADK